MDKETKNGISHRAKGVALLRAFLSENAADLGEKMASSVVAGAKD